MGIYLFVNRGKGGGKHTSSIILPSQVQPRVVFSLLRPRPSAYVPFLPLEVALHQEESEEKPAPTGSGYADDAKEPGRHRSRGPAELGGAAHGGRASQKPLPSPREQGGRWKGQG